MYHQQPPQRGPQPFSNTPRPSHHQPPPRQHPNRNTGQGIGFQFSRPNQLPDELESALAIRGGGDMDHRQIDHMNQPNPHQNQGPGSGISQHRGYGSNPLSIPADNPPGHQQGVDWSGYQSANTLFSSNPSSANLQQGQQQSQSNQSGARTLNWNHPDLTSTQSQQSHGTGGGGEGQGLYTPESAGSILASFGLSKDDLEVLSHYPDDQLTPDTLPFILRDIQINKSDKDKTLASTSSFSRNIHDIPTGPSCSSHSPEVLSLLTVTQMAGKVIDYGHASRVKDKTAAIETFKREQLSSERTVKMYPTASSPCPSADKTERHQVHLEHKNPSKHEDKDYRTMSRERNKSSRSPEREFTPKSRNLDRDYRHESSKPRPPSESRSEDSSRRSLSSSSASRPHGSSKKLPTPTMISDFEAASPKVYPHTCSLCHIQCDQETDWVNHVNTVDHTAARRDLRNKYPDWRPNPQSGRHGGHALWNHKDGSAFDSGSRSRSRSPHLPKGRYRGRFYRPHERPYSPYRQPRPHNYPERGHRFAQRSHSPPCSRRTSLSSRDHLSKSSRELSGSSRIGVKRSHDTSRSPSSSSADHSSKHEPSASVTKSTKTAAKPGTKTTKPFVKPPPLKKKKKAVAPASLGPSVADRLVFLTNIPKDATEQEVNDLAGSFGKINNVVLMPCSEEEGEKDQGQKASVCMMTAEDAKALASATKLHIRDQEVTASVAKRPEEQIHDYNGKPDADIGVADAAVSSRGGDIDQKTPDQKCKVLITGLPASGWSDDDIINLVQPFGPPSDIILAASIGKALVSLPDLEVAEEMVKVHSFKPARVNNTEVKVSLVKQNCGFDSPVALYNLLIGSPDPLGNPTPVGWSSLLVIKNVPDSSSGSSEVIKLVRRFGTVIKTLVLNGMVICEMATAAMALSVFKRFQMFPCIINNNPLFFQRRADPKPYTQTKVIAAFCGSSQDKPPSEKDGPTEAPKEMATAHQQDSQTPQDSDDEVKSIEKTAEDESLGEGDKTEEVGPDSDLVTDSKETSATQTDDTEEKKDLGAVEEENMQKTEPVSCEGKAASQEPAVPELPKMTQAMVNVLLMECRTRTANQTNNTAAPSGGEEDAQRDTEQGGRAEDATKDLAKSTEEKVKLQERERKEREAKKEKKERERRAWEKERAKRERERFERVRRERREEERREKERRERRRGSGSSSSYRSSSWRDKRYAMEDEARKEEVEESEDFPFNFSDFVTVDEVGDVADLPCAPSLTTETSKEGGDAPTAAQQEALQDTPVESTATSMKSEEVSEPDGVSVEKASDGLMESLSTLGQELNTTQAPPLASTLHSSPLIQPEAPEADLKPKPEPLLTSSLDSGTETAPETSADLPSNSQAAVVTAGNNDEKESGPEDQSEEGEKKVSQQEDQNLTEGEKNEAMTESAEPGLQTSSVDGRPAGQLPAVSQTGQSGKAEDNTDSREETELSVKSDQHLPPYDANNPVGLEYLVPKTGFFCKVCSRFFSGGKVAEISHCRTLKHYENLQNFLLKMKPSGVKQDSS
uniref:Matrin-type domain-containing protein n=1 Tax=Nothobranchius kadleci TaxID=1051664 RepID=A0A1A8DYW7_NOTKA